jgi:general stress protein YciG
MAESKRGFASMDERLQREIARKGGRAAHERGSAHQFTPEEAREAGRKGGQTVSRNREHMAAIGRRGGAASGLQRGTRRRAAERGRRPDADGQRHYRPS